MRVAIVLTLTVVLSLSGLNAQSDAGAWADDIALVQRELPRRHPDLFRFYAREAFEADMAALSAHLEGKSDLQIGLELQAILARFQDANTKVDLTPLLQQGKVIPIGLGWYAGGMYVSGTVKKFGVALGKRVLEINGMPVETALERLSRFFPCENPEALRRDGPQWLRFPEAMRMAGVSADDSLALLLVDEKGQRYFLKTYPVDFKKDKTGLQPVQYTPNDPDLRWNPVKQVFSLNWLEADRIVYLQYNGCFSQEMQLALGDSLGAQQLPPFQPLADSLVAILDRHPDARFFFDLRFNTSGMPADGIDLAQRLGLLPAINQPNRLYIALNRYSAGPALEIAAAFRTKTQATLIGEPPAQRPNHYADPGTLVLPNSRLQVSYGTRKVDGLRADPAVLPLDVPLDMPFEAFRDGRDALLDFVRQKQ